MDGTEGGGREGGMVRERGKYVGRECGKVEKGTCSGCAKSTVVGRAMCGLCVNLAVDGSVEAGKG